MKDANSLRFQHQSVCRLTLAYFSECQTPKCNAKVRIVERIDERIDGTVHPAQPSQHAHFRLANRLPRQKWYQQIAHEEWQPTRDEATHDHAQRLGCFRFTFRG